MALEVGIVGLQTVHLAHVNARRMADEPAEVAAQTQAASSVSAISPANFAAIYAASTLASASNATSDSPRSWNRCRSPASSPISLRPSSRVAM